MFLHIEGADSTLPGFVTPAKNVDQDLIPDFGTSVNMILFGVDTDEDVTRRPATDPMEIGDVVSTTCSRFIKVKQIVLADGRIIS